MFCIDKGKLLGVLSGKTTEYLVVNNPVTPVFHYLPTIHKFQVPVCGCPIVVVIGSILELLSEWVDLHLMLLSQRLPGYIQDTGDVLSQWKMSNGQGIFPG